jgi:hypothetical protein
MSGGHIPCHTCGRLPVGTFDDGSPRYDHGHRPDGSTWEATAPAAQTTERPLAMLMDRERFTGRRGRRWERWRFVVWTADRGAVEVVGITSTVGLRRRRWERAVSSRGLCRVDTDDDGIRDVIPWSRRSPLSEGAVAHYADVADALAPNHDSPRAAPTSGAEHSVTHSSGSEARAPGGPSRVVASASSPPAEAASLADIADASSAPGPVVSGALQCLHREAPAGRTCAPAIHVPGGRPSHGPSDLGSPPWMGSGVGASGAVLCLSAVPDEAIPAEDVP